MTPTFPGESAEYRDARDRLLRDEIALRRAIEAVAAARRALPPGGPVREDYVFQGPGADVRPDAGSPPRRHDRAALEPVRPHAGGASGRLGRAAELSLISASARR